MQASQLKALIERYGATLADAGAAEMVTRLQVLADGLGRGGAQAAAKFLISIEKSGFERSASDGPTLGHLVPVVENLTLLLKEAGAKKVVVADLEVLLDLIRRHSEVSLNDFESSAQRSVASASSGKAKPGAPAVDTKQLIELYLQRLEGALGNDAQFRTVYRELSADKKISKTETVEIASQFFEPLAKSTSRSKALQKISTGTRNCSNSRDASKSIGGTRLLDPIT